MKIIAITGHRIVNGNILGRNGSASVESLHETITSFMEASFPNQDLHLMIGGGLGFDLLMGSWSLSRNIPYTVILPFLYDIHTQKWNQKDKELLMHIVKNSHEVSVLAERYETRFYFQRNKMLVDNSHEVVCYWDGRKTGGTWWTVNYAMKNGKKVRNLYDHTR